MKIITIFVNILFVIFLCHCKPEEILLHGDVTGLVTDAETSEPIQAAAVKLNQSSVTTDTTSTGSNGQFLFTNKRPGYYEIGVSKPAYEKVTKDTVVTSANTTHLNFTLNGVPDPKFSDTFLDFGIDSTLKSFTIWNAGKGKLRYSLIPNQDWISIDPANGEVTTEMDTIEVAVNKTGLSDTIHTGIIRIISTIGDDIQEDIVDVLVNGVMDQDGNYYPVVTIGTQMWTARNLNTGTMISYGTGMEPENNGKIEKYCYENLESNCDVYGGLYFWGEMMHYTPDTSATSTVQGICPDGWHIPTNDDWNTLIQYLGSAHAGGKLKATGTLQNGDGLWESPNFGATNESGFTALPGGSLYTDEPEILPPAFGGLGMAAMIWVAYDGDGNGMNMLLVADGYTVYEDSMFNENCVSLRCVRDP